MTPHSITCRHTALFYKEEAGLRQSIAPHIAAALRAGRPVLVIASAEMRQAFALEMHRQHVLGAPFGSQRGNLLMLDAEETLDSFCIAGHPDAALFGEKVGSVVKQLAGEGPYLTAYGEMVNVLCERGQFADAIRVEEMWNELLATVGGRLFCGYASSLFETPAGQPFRQRVLATHTHAETVEVV